jgi:arylsulfatase A-like enzyme
VRFLEESGLSHQTCLIVTSDHGEEFREHGDTFHHSAKLYEELVRIPLVVSCPTMFEGGRVIEYPVSLVDLLPTVLEIANIAVPPRLDGESLVPLLEGTGGLARQATVSEVDGSVNSKGGRAFAFRTERYKLIESTFAGTRELFDLQDDPAEERDISREKPRVVKRLIKIARAERRRRLRSTAPDTATPAEATLERLRALGYDL